VHVVASAEQFTANGHAGFDITASSVERQHKLHRVIDVLGPKSYPAADPMRAAGSYPGFGAKRRLMVMASATLHAMNCSNAPNGHAVERGAVTRDQVCTPRAECESIHVLGG
jgi:hypothetical protein